MFQWISSAFGAGDNAETAVPDQRREPRRPQSSRTVALGIDGKWVRMPLINLSTLGASGEVPRAIEAGSAVIVAFENGLRVAGTVRSAVGRRVGIEFEKALPLDVVEGEGLSRDPVARRRYPRLAADTLVEVIINGKTHPARLENVSAAGAGIVVSLPLSPGQQVAIAMTDHSVRHGQVRWYDKGQAGIMFAVPTGCPVAQHQKI